MTPELLNALEGLPLQQAAAAVGVSVTALKKACRRLGIARWGYRRGAGRRGRDAAHGAQGQVGGQEKLAAIARGAIENSQALFSAINEDSG